MEDHGRLSNAAMGIDARKAVALATGNVSMRVVVATTKGRARILNAVAVGDRKAVHPKTSQDENPRVGLSRG